MIQPSTCGLIAAERRDLSVLRYVEESGMLTCSRTCVFTGVAAKWGGAAAGLPHPEAIITSASASDRQKKPAMPHSPRASRRNRPIIDVSPNFIRMQFLCRVSLTRIKRLSLSQVTAEFHYRVYAN